MKRVLLAWMLALTLVGAIFAYATTPLPAPTGYVNDFAGVLSAEAKADLEQELVQFNASTTNEIAVVTVTSMNGDYIEHYAPELFQQWGIGTEKNDNGVLLLVSTGDRKVRIEVGYGLEGALPDSVAASIIADMTPDLKNGDYDGALTLGVREIMSATNGEYQGTGATNNNDFESYVGFFVFGIFILQWLLAILARSKSYWAGGLLGGVAGAALASFLGWWVLGGAVLTGGLVLLGLLLDYGVSQTYSSAKSSGFNPPWWTGGAGGFGGGSSSGGFGGFGGGSSGGGGASGSY